MEYQDWRTSIEEPEQITNASITATDQLIVSRTIMGVATTVLGLFIFIGIIGIIVGITRTAKGNQDKGKRMIIGSVIIIVISIVLNIILVMTRLNIMLNM